MSCTSAVPSTGAAMGAGQIIVGGQDLYVRLEASNFSTAGNQIEFDVSLRNLLGQAMGTLDGSSTPPADSGAVRIFFYQNLQSRDGEGNVIGAAEVENPSGYGMFLQSATPYFDYFEVIAPEATSAVRRWALSHVPGAESVTFRVYVWSRIQHPEGWIALAPEDTVLVPGDSVRLTPTIWDHLAQTPYTAAIDWATSDPAVATVDELGWVRSTGLGEATITASAMITTSRGNVTVTGSADVVVNTPLLAQDVTYPALGNVTLPVPAHFGLTHFVEDPDGDAVSIIGGTYPTDAGGSITFAEDGSFAYHPPAGLTAASDNVTYRATDGIHTAEGTLTLAVGERHWFVRAGADPAGDGRSGSPFAALKAAEDASADGETIFVLDAGAETSGVDEGIVLKDGQSLIGEGIAEAVLRRLGMPTAPDDSITLTLLAPGNAPGITRAGAGATVTLGVGNTLRGIGISSTQGAGISGSGFGTLTTDAVAVSAAGPALALSQGTLAGSFSVLSSTGSAGRGLSLVGVDGTLAPAGGAISNAAGEAVYVEGGALDLSYAGSISNAAGRSVHVTGRSAGSVTLSGSLVDTGTGIAVTDNSGGTVTFGGPAQTLLTGASPAVSLTGNTGATVSFTGGGLAVTTTSGAGFRATGGGTVVVSGAANTVATGIGTAVEITGTTIGGAGVTFRSVTGEGPSGIVLSGTGSDPFTVTGQAPTAGSGGTLSIPSGGTGVSLGGGANAQLSWMSLSGSGTGILANAFGTLAVDGVSVSSTGAPALSLTGGTVTGTFASVSASGSAGHGVVLSGVGGSFGVAGGSVQGSGNGAALFLTGNQNGGTVTWNGVLAQASAHPLLQVTSHTGGTLNLGGALSSDGASTGLVFSGADGSYGIAPAAATTFSGSGGAISITGSSTGTFTFSGNLSAAYSAGAVSPFVVSGASPTATFNGGLGVSGSATGALVSVTNMAAGSLTFATGTLAASAGPGIALSNVDGGVAFNGTTTLSGSSRARISNGSSGAISFGAGTTITNPSAEPGLYVTNAGAAANVSFGGSITSNNRRPVQVEGVGGGSVTVSGNLTATQEGLLVQSNSGGTITFSGTSKSLNTGTNPAVTLTSNNGATVAFTNGGLVIATTTATGFGATGGGTVTVGGTGNSIASGTGTALFVQNTNIGAGGLLFASISANGAANGIHLANTGAGGGLQVTGNGSTHGSGGTIQNIAGADGAAAGNGIYLSNTRNVSLAWMNLSGIANNGVYATGVHGLSVFRVRTTGSIGNSNSGAHNESPIHMENVSGPISIRRSLLNGGAMNAVRLYNTSALAIDSLVMEHDTVTHLQGSTSDVRGTALLVDVRNGSVDTRIRDNHVTHWWGNGIHVLVHANASASGTTRITGNTVHNGNGALAGAGGIWVAGGNHQYNISGNSVRYTNGTAISADRTGPGAHMQGTIENNSIGASGQANSGTATGIAIYASATGPNPTTVRIRDNTIRQVNGSASGAITVVTGDHATGGGQGTMNATVSGNNIQESGTTVNNAQHGILITHDRITNDATVGCYDILNNTIVNFTSGTANNRIRVNQRFSGVSRYPGYTGSNNDNTALGNYLLGRNTASTFANTNNVGQGGSGHTNTIPAGSPCQQPAI